MSKDTHTTTDGWSIVGHGWVATLLQQAIVAAGHGRGPGHAYLFTGPRHIGKSTLATVFAQALLCDQQSGIPCGECRACRLMAHGRHPDFRLVQPSDREGNADRTAGLLRVEQAEALVHEVTLRPVEGRYKIYLLQDVHRTTNDIFSNKILKTLEEPSAYVKLLLTADNRSNVLPTIVSRCQVLALRPPETPVVERALSERWSVAADEAALLARLAYGRVGWAVTEARDTGFAGRRQESLQTLQRLVAADRVERLTFAERLAGSWQGASIFELLEIWTSWWRDVLLAQAGCGAVCSNVDALELIEQQAARIAPATVRDYLGLLNRLDGYLHHTVNVRMALDVLLLRLPRTR